MLAAIDFARSSVCLEVYIFAPSPLGKRFREAMVRAQQRGVRVRVLVDALGSMELPSDFWQPLQAVGGEARGFNPVGLMRFWFRDHRKLLVCDGRVTALDAIGTAYEGARCGQIYEGNRVFDVSVILDEDSRKNITQVAALPLRSPGGSHIPLRDVAAIYQDSGRYVVLHQGAQRVQTITCNVSGRDVDSFVAEAQRRIQSDVKLPAGTYVEFGGTATGEARARHDLLIHSLLAGLGIVLLLSVIMRNGRNLTLVLLNLPFALVGGVLAVFASGGLLSIGALVGFVTLFGITLRNSIMMISHYEHLVSVEDQLWGPETALRGAAERLTPILMTALVTGLGLLPLAIGSGDPGREIEGPMAIVILGGLLTSTVLNLLVLPTLALRYGRFDSAQKQAESSS
jgi:Cu/Ag efflux pump CusA